MKKKLCLLIVFIFLFSLFVFAEPQDEKEEVDYLLFQPNMSDRFADERQASVQLDNLARFLLGKNLSQGQIYVYGYSADVLNDIDPDKLSYDRANFIINELIKRGVTQNLFSAPVAYGVTSNWDDITIIDSLSPNRRVRILLLGETQVVITPELVEIEIKPDIAVDYIETDEITEHVFVTDDIYTDEKPASKFPFFILLFLLIPLLLLLLLLALMKKKKQEKPTPSKSITKPVVKPEPVVEPEPVYVSTPEPEVTSAAEPEPVTKPEPVIVPPAAVPGRRPKSAELIAAETESGLDLEDLIRRRAYQHFEQRGYTHGCHDTDWYVAETEILAWYELYKKDKSIGLPFNLTWN
jgi:hypothetical protein